MITALNIYEKICEVTTEDERSHWQTDLYCKVTPATREIIRKYEYRGGTVEIFTDQITRTFWYAIPFVYPLKRG